jgi:drug/metabolite transporter (DMT)-like permease
VISWSSGFVGIRFASEDASVLLVLFWRTLVSGLVLLPFALTIGGPIGKRALLQQMLFGVLGMFLYLAGFAVAIGQRVPTGLVALIADLVPLAIAALSQPVLGHRLSRRQWLGTAIGCAGVVLVSIDGLSLGTAPFLAYALPVAAMLIFALATVLQKRLGAIHMPIHQSLCIQCLTASVLFAVCAGFEGNLMPPLDGRFEFGIAWLVLLSTFLCYSLYYLSLRIAGDDDLGLGDVWRTPDGGDVRRASGDAGGGLACVAVRWRDKAGRSRRRLTSHGLLCTNPARSPTRPGKWADTEG